MGECSVFIYICSDDGLKLSDHQNSEPTLSIYSCVGSNPSFDHNGYLINDNLLYNRTK